MLNKVKNWINARVGERTSWDGSLLIIAGVSFLIFKPLASILAYAAIAYGIWTLVKPE